MAMRCASICLALAASAVPAAAQPAEPVEPTNASPELLSAFALLDRQDAVSHAGAALGISHADPSGGSVSIVRLDLHGEYVNDSTGFGVYGQVPFTSENDHFAGDMSSGGIGNLDVGALWVVRTGDASRLIVHTGVVMPTSSKDEQGNQYSAMLRPSDAVLEIPDGFSVRAGASLLVRQGAWFERFDAGIDSNVSAASPVTVGPTVHVGAGAGVDTGKLALTAELVVAHGTWFTSYVSNNAQSVGDLALAVHGNFDRVRPFVAAMVPLGRPTDDSGSGYISIAVIGGLQFLP
jgi:hypothetical protein